MDRLFVNGKRAPKKFRLRDIVGRREGGAESDSITEYFPYSGGGGDDAYTYEEQYLSYEPAELLVDSDVKVEGPDGIGHNLKRVLVKGSRYDVYEARSRSTSDSVKAKPVPSRSPGTEIPPELALPISAQKALQAQNHNNSSSTESLPSEAQRKESARKSWRLKMSSIQSEKASAPPSAPPTTPPTPATTAPSTAPGSRVGSRVVSARKPVPSHENSSGEPLWTLQWLNDLHVDLDSVIGMVRKTARSTGILMPIDMAVDYVSRYVAGAPQVGAVVELFLLMLLGDVLAKVLRVVCRPAVLVLNVMLAFL